MNVSPGIIFISPGMNKQKPGAEQAKRGCLKSWLYHHSPLGRRGVRVTNDFLDSHLIS